MLTAEQEALLLSPDGFVDPTDKQPAAQQQAAPVQQQQTAPVEQQQAAPVEQQQAAPVEQQQAAPVNYDDIDDDTLNAILEKRGKKVVAAGQEQVLSKEEIKRQKEASMLNYALTNNVFTMDKYNKFQVAKVKEPYDIVFERYCADRPNEEVEKLRADFARLYLLDADDDYAYLSERRKKDMESEAQRILKDEYPEMYSLEKKYDEWDTTQKATARTQQEQQQQETQYRQAIENVSTTIKGRSITINEDDQHTETFDFVYPDALLKQVKDHFLAPETIAKFRGSTPEQITDAYNLTLLKLSHDAAVSFASKAYHSKKIQADAANRRNMQPDDIASGITHESTHDAAAWALINPEIAAQVKKDSLPQ